MRKADLAIVPGSFKPPHKGHLDMIKQYSNMADKVLVLISNPKLNGVRIINDKVIDPSDVLKIFKLYIKAENLSNIQIEISCVPSPVKATYDYIEALKEEKTIIVGSSTKDAGIGKDYDRWKNIQTYMSIKNPLVNIINPVDSAVTLKYNVSATDLREAIMNDEDLDKYLPDSVIKSESVYDDIIEIFDKIG